MRRIAQTSTINNKHYCVLSIIILIYRNACEFVFRSFHQTQTTIILELWLQFDEQQYENS